MAFATQLMLTYRRRIGAALEPFTGFVAVRARLVRRPGKRRDPARSRSASPLMIIGISSRAVVAFHVTPMRTLPNLCGPFMLVNTGCFLRVTLQTLID